MKRIGAFEGVSGKGTEGLVSGDESDVITERLEQLRDRIPEVSKIAHGEIDASDRALEQDITHFSKNCWQRGTRSHAGRVAGLSREDLLKRGIGQQINQYALQ